jgi:tetratricopeptide (TPR) repeat protein
VTLDNPVNQAHGRGQNWLACLLLAIAVLAAYWPALNCDFVLLDDPEYVTSNRHIQNGLDWPVAAWAFQTGYAANWHPVTWLSHALDVQLFGLNPRGHHGTSIALHLANSILLFLVLKRMTGAHWRSAAVAGLFAVHPLHVESVAWVAERKDVLSTFFWLLTVAAYARYVENLKFQISNFKFFYIGSVVLFALGLMSKPMVVTLPFVLLLLDYWPLGRFANASRQTISRLWLEKAPFLLLAAASCVITFCIQNQAGVVWPLAKISLGGRLDNLPVAYERYLAKTFWPGYLGVFYHHPRIWPLWRFITASALLAGITVWVVRRRRRQPYLAVGWFWFLGMLVPVLGLVQVGNQSMADRYAYLPIVGIFIMTVWGAGEMPAGRAGGKWTAAISGLLAIGICGALTWRQAHFWKNMVTLCVHTSEITADNYEAFYNLGRYWQHKGETARAAEYYQKCLQAKPDYALAHNNLGYILLQDGKTGAAIAHFKASLRSQPVDPEACYNLGRACMSNGLAGEAAECFQKALGMDPGVAEINYSLGEALQQLGRLDSARPCFERALELRPNFASAHYKLANLLLQQGWVSAAAAHYQRALELRPDSMQACNNLAWLMATCPEASFRNGPRAVTLAKRAEQLTGGRNALVIGTLAAAQAEAGNFAEAIAAAGRARQLASAQTNAALVNIIDTQEQQYRKGLPWRDATQRVKDARGK